MKTNVLFVFLQMGMGGAERLVYDLIRRIDRKRFAPSLAWFYGEQVLPEFEALDIPLYHIPKRRRFDPITMHQFARILQTGNIHVVNAHHFMSMVYLFHGCYLAKQARLVYTEHSEWEVAEISSAWRTIGRWLLHRVHRSVGVSPMVTQALRETFGLSEQQAVTIPNGVDLDRFNAPLDTNGLRAEWGIEADEKVIGMVANLKCVKNHLFLLQGFAELVKTLPRVRLILIGRGFPQAPDNTEPQIRRFIVDQGLEGRVVLAGFRPDVDRVLGLMEVCCLTSVQEGLPLSLIEAMAAGLPVVGTDVPGIRDLVRPDFNGFLVAPGDVAGLAQCLRTLLTRPELATTMGRSSKQWARSTYSLESCIRNYEVLFDTVRS